jgi:hypothetical protein
MPTHEVSIPTEPKRSISTATKATTAGRIMAGTLRRKVAKRSLALMLTEAEPVASSMSIDGDIRVAKKPRLGVPLLASPTTEKVARSSIRIASPVAEEAALPPADVYHMTATSSNASADGAPSSESTLENKVELPIRVVKPTIQRKHTSGKGMRKKGELSALAAMVAGIWAADQGKSTLETHNNVNSYASASLGTSKGQTTTIPGWNKCPNAVDWSIDQATGRHADVCGGKTQ